ncbi:hypothetical protein EBZ37_00615 [bacterium]|nr:hypothetical protein [bacterium]
MDMNTSDQMTSEKKNQSAEFQPPRHWLGVEELSPSYWQDTSTKEKRAQEFFEKPIESLSNLERSEGFSIARRDFLTIMGASMALSTVSCVRRPVHKIIPYVVKPEEITPGVANFYASTNPNTGSAVVVRVREGRPVKLEGNELSPLTKGKLSASEQAELLSLYDPERLKGPASRRRGSGSLSKMDWAAFDSAVVERLKRVSAAGGAVCVLSSEIKSDTTRKLIGEFLGQFKGFLEQCKLQNAKLAKISEPEYFGLAKSAPLNEEVGAPIIPDSISVSANWKFVWTFDPTPCFR